MANTPKSDFAPGPSNSSEMEDEKAKGDNWLDCEPRFDFNIK